MASLPSTVSAAAAPGARPGRSALAGLALCMLMPSLDTSIANVALPALADAFGAPFRQVQWVVLAYLLAVTAFIVGAGRLGDLFGRRRLLVTGIAMFGAASLLSAAAPTLSLLIAARAAQGLGAAIMMSLAMALVGEAVPKARTGSAIGLLGTMSAIGTTLGPSLGGLLIAGFGWQAVFLINLPVGIVSLWLVLRTLPADSAAPREQRPAFDSLGTLLLMLTLTAFALSVTLAGGAIAPLNLALLAVALLGGGLFLLAEARAASPLVPLHLLRDPALAAGLAASALVSTVMMATLIVGPFYLAGALRLDAARVGLVMSAGPLVAALAGVPGGRLVDRHGPRRIRLVALAGMAAALLALSHAPIGFGAAGYVVAIAAVTGAYALFQAANNTAVMMAAGPERRGLVSAMLGLSRNLGLIGGASAMGALFAFASAASDPAAAAPAALAAGMRITFSCAAVLVLLAFAIARRQAPVASETGRS